MYIQILIIRVLKTLYFLVNFERRLAKRTYTQVGARNPSNASVFFSDIQRVTNDDKIRTAIFELFKTSHRLLSDITFPEICGHVFLTGVEI